MSMCETPPRTNSWSHPRTVRWHTLNKHERSSSSSHCDDAKPFAEKCPRQIWVFFSNSDYIHIYIYFLFSYKLTFNNWWQVGHCKKWNRTKWHYRALQVTGQQTREQKQTVLAQLSQRHSCPTALQDLHILPLCHGATQRRHSLVQQPSAMAKLPVFANVPAHND